MKKTLTILTTIVLMAFTLCGCGTRKEILSHPKRTTASEPVFSTIATEATVETIETIETIEAIEAIVAIESYSSYRNYSFYYLYSKDA